jgi:protein TonB
MIPIMDKIVVELNVRDPITVKIQLIPADDSHNNEFTFVDTESAGVKDEVDTKFLSDKTQKVENETISSAMPAPGPKKEKELSLEDLKPNLEGDSISKAKSDTLQPKSGANGVAGSGDSYPIFDEDVSEGDKTNLNTIEFKYASFYKRMRDQVGNTWTPMVLNIGALAPGRYITRIILKINKDGEIIGMKLDAKSGNLVVDDVGYQTFSKIRVFPNPPAGLFNGKEYLYIPWTLELKN